MSISGASLFAIITLFTPFILAVIFAVFSIFVFVKISNMRKQNELYIKMSNDLLNEIDAVKNTLEKIEKLLKEVD
ncbi:hypothetical protein M2349_002638 [Caldanaerobacter subterraneus subsp. tengcongensis MB4]|uniref:Uncharacterized protein n=1 Tax=Caldanaerobacter subterraneus subsp. tengcongensis (strain DSM 15242 / JCM 11007 / NBRC 100824 / MB4) TaxID=273068 RepID=Q8R7B5_CALS4|nr:MULTISPECIES: hypothetical protein [Caldanaerobacter]MBE3592145.1 hypothetical protein [Thermoanaerobacter sp.]AAM25631.1 hypothetical protein TTE2501 [Caldanaerobacter subterraneus subsp. tengcongensis MB4]MCS3917497.1 hypothetical protein [Caldanaerobacter subterraneus subsp. tengcongensis MB4]MDI3518293.1 hypothetical protein [Caldanaerobacter sp.]MDK2794080.1 hypothetical protein [Caldanaerobacter sp.]